MVRSLLSRLATRSPVHFARTTYGVQLIARNFHATPRRLETAAPLPIKKPVGAFRGGIFGFLLGSTLAGAAVYSYILAEYRVSNELLTEDIYALQAAVQRIEVYVRGLEVKLIETQKK